MENHDRPCLRRTQYKEKEDFFKYIAEENWRRMKKSIKFFPGAAKNVERNGEDLHDNHWELSKTYKNEKSDEELKHYRPAIILIWLLEIWGDVFPSRYPAAKSSNTMSMVKLEKKVIDLIFNTRQTYDYNSIQLLYTIA